MIETEPKRKISKRGRVGEGRPSKRTPEVVASYEHRELKILKMSTFDPLGDVPEPEHAAPAAKPPAPPGYYYVERWVDADCYAAWGTR
jgi:hypothetical protein